MTKNLLNDRRFLDSFDSEIGGVKKQKRPLKREAMDSMAKSKQRDRTRRLPKEY